MIIQLEHNVDQVMVPLNRAFPVQPPLPLWEGLYSVCCHASGRCLQQGKVMGVRYPGPVSRHNLVFPLLLMLWYLVPVWDRLSFAMTVAVDAFGRHGATHDIAQRGVGRSGGESVMGDRSVLWEHRWSTQMGVRGHGFRGVGTVCYLCRVCIKSIDSRARRYGPSS